MGSKFRPYKFPDLLSSLNSPDSNSSGSAYSDASPGRVPSLEAKYAALRKERRRMKREAIDDLRRLTDMVGGKAGRRSDDHSAARFEDDDDDDPPFK